MRAASGWPAARVISAAHVDAMLGTDAAQAPYSDSAASRRLTEWFCELERCHRHLIFVADRDDSTWALRCLRQADCNLAAFKLVVSSFRANVVRQLRSKRSRFITLLHAFTNACTNILLASLDA